VLCVREAGKEMCARLLEPLRAKYGPASLARIDQAVRIYVREAAPVYPDPRQQPTFFYLPGLPTTPYLDRALFPWIPGLEAQTDAIRAELLQLLPTDRGRERVFTTEELEDVNLRGTGAAPTWNGYYFFRYGVRRDENHLACPATSAALASVDLCHIRDHGPEVLYSVFTAGTHLLPHRGVTNTRLVAHLPLIVPPDCALNVSGEVHAWQEGRVVVFDDTFEHEAWNRSDRVRVILLMDIWNPHLTEVERLAVADLVAAIGDFRKQVEQG
jgi:aspartate beta-hydroxylase